MKYQGLVKDRMNYAPIKKTFWYSTYEEAHKAAELLCSMYYKGDRGEIDVTTSNAE